MKRPFPSGHDPRTVRRSFSTPLEPDALASHDLVVLSHLRWDFVFQRPHHLMCRSAAVQRVFYVEEPVYGSDPPRLEVRPRANGVITAVPHLPVGTDPRSAVAAQRRLLDELFETHAVRDPILWYYTPMALPFTRHLAASTIVYDCMDELTGFKGAPAELPRLERELLASARVVFVGGRSLYEAKRRLRRDIHLFPSSIDAAHFATAHEATSPPRDQALVPRPRLGYFGVVDERMDLALLDGIARARPDWHIVLVGPVAKIDPSDLPRLPNLHALGPKPYEDLPAYLAGWDVALLPFALNAATRFISPTKTPEYLAAGRPVVSAPIRDVVRPYAELGLVRIADGVSAWLRAIEETLAEDPSRPAWREAVDSYLASTSWDRTWAGMMRLVEGSLPDARRASARRGARGADVTADAATDS